MEIQQEIQEYTSHVKSLEVVGSIIYIRTLEDIYISGEFNTQGLFIKSSSVFLDRTGYDDLGQLLTSVSPGYRNSFSNELIAKLSKLENN